AADDPRGHGCEHADGRRGPLRQLLLHAHGGPSVRADARLAIADRRRRAGAAPEPAPGVPRVGLLVAALLALADGRALREARPGGAVAAAEAVGLLPPPVRDLLRPR